MTPLCFGLEAAPVDAGVWVCAWAVVSINAVSMSKSPATDMTDRLEYLVSMMVPSQSLCRSYSIGCMLAAIVTMTASLSIAAMKRISFIVFMTRRPGLCFAYFTNSISLGLQLLSKNDSSGL
jgi:hypothetical protein